MTLYGSTSYKHLHIYSAEFTSESVKKLNLMKKYHRGSNTKVLKKTLICIPN